MHLRILNDVSVVLCLLERKSKKKKNIWNSYKKRKKLFSVTLNLLPVIRMCDYSLQLQIPQSQVLSFAIIIP